MLSNKYLLTTPGSICMGGLKWVRTQVWGKLQGGGGGGCSLKACTRPSNSLLSRPHPGSPPTHHPSIHWIYPLHCAQLGLSRRHGMTCRADGWAQLKTRHTWDFDTLKLDTYDLTTLAITRTTTSHPLLQLLHRPTTASTDYCEQKTRWKLDDDSDRIMASLHVDSLSSAHLITCTLKLDTWIWISIYGLPCLSPTSVTPPPPLTTPYYCLSWYSPPHGSNHSANPSPTATGSCFAEVTRPLTPPPSSAPLLQLMSSHICPLLCLYPAAAHPPSSMHPALPPSSTMIHTCKFLSGLSICCQLISPSLLNI